MAAVITHDMQIASLVPPEGKKSHCRQREVESKGWTLYRIPIREPNKELALPPLP